MPKSRAPGLFNAPLALQMARAFHSRVSEMLAQVPKGLNEANNYMAADTARTVFIVINLLYTTEIYIKICAKLAGKEIWGHDLWKLFEQLPASVQKGIQEEFSKKFASWRHDLKGMTVFATRQLTESEVLDAMKKAEVEGDPTSVERVLKESADTYVVWRYLYESLSNDKDCLALIFNWTHLDCLCAVLDDVITGQTSVSLAP